MTDSGSRQMALRVRGRVQGVGFRWSAAREAEALGLRGCIRNAPDGTVEVSVEGAADAVERFVRWLGKGPPGSRVDAVEPAEVGLQVPENGFRIVR